MPPAPKTRALGGLLGAAALLLLLQGTLSQMHTTLEVMNDSCDAQLQSLWNNYTSPPVAPVAGCNTTCLAACYSTLNWAIYSEKKQDCPLQVDIVRCMHVYRAQWIKFVNECALFEYSTLTSAEAEGEGGGSSSSSFSSTGESDSSSPTSEGEASLTLAEGSTTAEGEASSAGAGRRRVLLQEAEAAMGASGVDVYNGCFPNFKNSTEYEMYVNGEYVYSSNSSAWGITLSVFYYISLLLLGLGLAPFVKVPMCKGWAWTKSKLNCCDGGARKPTQLDPLPMQPQVNTSAAEAADTQPVADALTRPEAASASQAPCLALHHPCT